MNFSAGFRYQKYETSDIITHKMYIGPVARGGFEYKASERDKFRLTAERTVYESISQNINYYVANLLGLRYEHTFRDKVTASIYGSYQLHQYPSEETINSETAKRHDNYLNGGLALRYDMNRWFSFEMKYECTNKSSRFDIYDYLDHLVSLSGTAGF